MVEPMNPHYSFENGPTIYDEEATTALKLCAKTAGKMNETVQAFNTLETATGNHLSGQDEAIRKMNEETMPENVRSEVQRHIDEGDFDQAISDYAGELDKRVDNLLGSVQEGTTTLDAELIDIRLMQDGTVADTAGNAVRGAWKYTPRIPQLFINTDPVLNFDTVAGTVSTEKSFFAGYGLARHTVGKFSVPVLTDTNVQILAYNTKTKSVACIKEADYDRGTQVIICYFCYSTITNGVSCSLPFAYYINGQRVAVDKEIENARTNGGGETFPGLAQRLHMMDSRVTRKGELFFMGPASGIEFDTVARTLTMRGNSYVVFDKMRYDFQQTVILDFPDTTANTLCLVIDNAYDVDQRAYKVIEYSAWNRYTQILVFVFNQKNLNVPQSNTIMIPYMVDGATYSRYDGGGVSGDSGKVAYVSTSGHNSNSGTLSAPFATIQKAIDSGASTIIVAPGTYKARFVTSEVEKLHILCGWDYFNEETNPKRGKVIIDGSEPLAMSYDAVTGLYKAPYTADTGNMLYRVFVSRELPLSDGGTRSVGYNANLWVRGTEPVKVVPVQTVDEVKASEGPAWSYDGTHVYLKWSDGVPDAVISGNFKSCEVWNCHSLVLEDMVFQYAGTDCLKINKCHNVQLRNCEFNYSGLQNGVYLYNANGRVENCSASYNRNDGFNLHGFGDTTVINCHGRNNYDDGISHHDGCTGSIIGGIWEGNGKGGVASPTHGAKINVSSAILTGNRYGIFADDITGLVTDVDIITVNNCLITGNQTGVYTCYPIIGVNNVLTGNTTDTQVKGVGSFTNH